MMNPFGGALSNFGGMPQHAAQQGGFQLAAADPMAMANFQQTSAMHHPMYQQIIAAQQAQMQQQMQQHQMDNYQQQMQQQQVMQAGGQPQHNGYGQQAPSETMASGTLTIQKTAETMELERLRLNMPQFKNSTQKICTSYRFMGALWLHGKRQTLPKKFKTAAIMFINPKVWNALRLSLLDDNEVDYLMFVLFMVVPQVNVGDLQVNTKGHLYDMLLEEHIRIQRQHPHRFAALAADLSNVKACALELGYPKKYVQPEENTSIGTSAGGKVEVAWKGPIIEEIHDDTSTRDSSEQPSKIRRSGSTSTIGSRAPSTSSQSPHKGGSQEIEQEVSTNPKVPPGQTTLPENIIRAAKRRWSLKPLQKTEDSRDDRVQPSTAHLGALTTVAPPEAVTLQQKRDGQALHAQPGSCIDEQHTAVSDQAGELERADQGNAPFPLAWRDMMLQWLDIRQQHPEALGDTQVVVDSVVEEEEVYEDEAKQHVKEEYDDSLEQALHGEPPEDAQLPSQETKEEDEAAAVADSQAADDDAALANLG